MQGALDLASLTSHIHSWVFFLLWLHPFILSESKLTFPGVRWTPDGSHPSNREGEVRNDVMTKSGDQLRARGSLHVSFVIVAAHKLFSCGMWDLVP